MVAIGTACLVGFGSAGVASPQRETKPSRAKTPERSSATDRSQVNITRATSFLGTDVRTADGRKVGDIVDYVFDMAEAPHLAYVVVMTGGFLQFGGDRRAVPANAISIEDEAGRINISSEEYLKVPVLPDNQRQFLSDRRQAQEIARAFKVEPRDRGRRGAAASLVTFSELSNANITSTDGQRLGFCMDAWVSQDLNHAPFIEINPTYQPFRAAETDLRHAIPMARFVSRGEFAGFEFAVGTDDLAQAQHVTEVDGVRMLQSGTVDDTVLRVQLAEVGRQQQTRGAE